MNTTAVRHSLESVTNVAFLVVQPLSSGARAQLQVGQSAIRPWTSERWMVHELAHRDFQTKAAKRGWAALPIG